MKVVHHHTRTGAISGNLNMLSFLNTHGNMVYMKRWFTSFFFFNFSGFTLKSFLIMGIPKDLIISIVEECLQDL